MRSRTLCRMLVVGLVAALLQLAGHSSVAMAAPAAPRSLSPSGTSSTGQPVLSWARVSSATSYEVQLAAVSDFSPLLYTVTTTNRRATPFVNLPPGELYWRVRAITASGTRGAWAATSFTRSSLAGPTLSSPSDNDQLQQPEEPARLDWQPVVNATSYTIEVDDDNQFIQPKVYTSATTSFVLPDPGPELTYFWHVRANFAGGFNSLWSDVHSFKVLGIDAPDLTYPDDSATNTVEDATLDWQPVAGAVRYEVRVSTDDQFNTIVDSATVVSTRYARPATLNNDQYWWEVRAIDVNGNKSPWTTSLFQFQRNWPQKPVLDYPVDNSTVGEPFYYQWEPVRHASSYRLDVGTDPNFSPSTFSSCVTSATTYTPRSTDTPGCSPTSGNTYYWRVRGLDYPSAVNGIYSEIHRFTYLQDIVNQVSPANGATVDIPTLTWSSYPQAETYKVVVKKASGAVAASATTYSLSWTPTGTARLNPSDGPFRWTVQAVGHDGKLSQIPLSGTERTFSLSGVVDDDPAVDALTPKSPADGAGSLRFPVLSWEPWFTSDATPAPADYYEVVIGTPGNPSVTVLSDKFPYTTATDTSKTYLQPGTYTWFVRAFKANTLVATYTGPEQTFVIKQLADVSAQRVSLTGNGLGTPANACSVRLDATSGPTICSNLRQTPAFAWATVPQAAYYMVYVTRDKELTNAVYGTDPVATTTSSTYWIPTDLLPDSQAGTAYYWVVRPCKATGVCAPEPLAATNAFDKRSFPVSGLQEREHDSDAVLPPADPTDPSKAPQFADEVTLSWDPYVLTNQQNPDRDVTGLPATVEARWYRVQISTDPTFTGRFNITSPLIDQTSYTPFSTLLPEGNLYWRVQAVDDSGNSLSWSLTRNLSGETHAIEKRSPRPANLDPSGGISVTGTPALSWSALKYAARYEVEVYKNNDTTFSAANRVLSASVVQPTYASPKILAAAGSPYIWRVRRIDISNNAGAWSVPEKFMVKGLPPAQVSPASGAYVVNRDAYFTWKPVAGAAYYHFERRPAGQSYSQEVVNTPGLSWAPTATIADGSYEWKVSAYDAAGNVLGGSPWRSFAVDSVAPKVVSKSPTRTASRSTNFVVKFSEPVRHVDTTTMALFVKGQQHRLPATVKLSDGGRTATLNPSTNLRVGKVYTVRLNTRITDRAGLHLKGYGWTVTAT